MENCIKIVMFLALMLLSSCIRNKPQNTTILKPEIATISSVEKSKEPSFSLDTLNFLDYEMLMDFQENGFEHLFQNILSYALSSEIKIIRNEMFARKGYIFKDAFLQKYFSLKNWYQPECISLESINLSYNEHCLLDTLLKYEKVNASFTRDTIKQIFINEYLTPSLGENHSEYFSLALWTQAVDKKRTCYIGSNGDRWDYSGNAYSVTVIDTVYNYYHCRLDFWCGGEGSGCYSSQTCILDKNLDLLDCFTVSNIYNVEKVANNKYKHETVNNDDDEYYVFDTGFYSITKEGKFLSPQKP
jgi:hypothetical protein